MNANEKQIAGDHYRTEYQHWDFVYNSLGGRYLEGQITKYVTRWRKKNGKQDLEKALHFADKLAEVFRADLLVPMGEVNRMFGMAPQKDVERYCEINGLDYSERRVMEICSSWVGGEELRSLRDHISALILAADVEAQNGN